MAASPPRRCPLPIATRQTARALIRLHCRLRGELLKAERGSEVLVDRKAALTQMAHVEGLLKFLSIRFDQSTLRPLVTVPKVGHLEHGGLRRGILRALKARGTWLTYREITDAIVLDRKLKMTATQHAHFLQAVREAAHALTRDGTLVLKQRIAFGDHRQIQRVNLAD
jgi:hypothetical protein